MKVSLKAQIFLAASLQSGNKKYCLISVLAGGCAGYKYDIIFSNVLPNDFLPVATNVYVDSYSLSLLKNSFLELDESIGIKKIVISNKDSKSTCSCGMSFST